MWQMGITVGLHKPVLSSDLFDAIVNSPELRSLGTPSKKLERAIHVGRRPQNLLLAEDNAVNQMLARVLPQKIGRRVTVAANVKLELWLWRAHGG